MQYLIFFFSIVAMLIIVKILAWPIKKIIKLIINILLGLLLILIVNTFGNRIGLYIPFNAITALISGLLGLPGVICLAILNYIF